MPRRPSMNLAAALSTGMLLFLACDSTLEPDNGSRLPVGQTVAGTLSGSDSVLKYGFAGDPGETYAIYLEATEGVVALTVQDSVVRIPFASIIDSSGTGTLFDQMTGPIGTNSGQVLTVTLRRGTGVSRARFQLLVYHVMKAPEKVSATFAVGQYVEGETIEPSADADEFITHLVEGNLYVVQVELVAPSVVGAVQLDAFRPGGQQDVATAFAVNAANFPPSRPSDVFTAPVSGEYPVRIHPTNIGLQKWYSGAYRFRVDHVDPAPEQAPVVLTPGTVTNESVDGIADIDDFTFTATAGQEFNVFIQAALSQGPTVQVLGSPSLLNRTTGAVAGDTGLYQHATGKFVVPAAGTYTLRVTGGGTPGPYRLLLESISPNPEHVPQSISVNDSISGERIDFPGDYDVFTVPLQAGEEYVAFLEPHGTASLHLDVTSAANQTVAVVETEGPQTILLQHRSERFTAPSSGSYRVKVEDLADRSDRGMGSYRFLVEHVTLAPEHTGSTLSLGDSVLSESIDFPGDADEWTVTVPDSSWINLVVTSGATGFDAPVVSLKNQAGLFLDNYTLLNAGTYTVRVEGRGAQSLYSGPYQLHLYAFQSGPETHAADFAIGDTISESIDAPGDFDVFRVHALKGQHLDLAFAAGGPARPGVLTGSLDVGPMPGARESPIPGVLDTLHSNRVDVPADGWYEVQVRAYGADARPAIPYRFTVKTLGESPEHVPATISVGTALTSEAIDFHGDWDQFTVTASPGQLVGVSLKSLIPASYPVFPTVMVRDPVTQDSLGSTFGQSVVETSTGPVIVPPSGQLAVSVYEDRRSLTACADANCTAAFPFVGGYRLYIANIDSATEAASASFAVGDTVFENIDPIGDVDTYTFTATAGQSLKVYFQITSVDMAQPGVIVHVQDASGATMMGSAIVGIAGPGTDTMVGGFTAPATGSYTLRVLGASDRSGSGPYRFHIESGP